MMIVKDEGGNGSGMPLLYLSEEIQSKNLYT
jgi:hypothetical protein